MRVCFRSTVRPEDVAEYRRRHAQVWPDMLRALERSGWQNYSLFLDDDGLLIGYLECEDYQESLALMQLEGINAQWQAHMKDLFNHGEQNPDQGFVVLPEVFNLAVQLEAAEHSGT